ncbi:MAG: uracil-DNA glycosylase [Deltaproteobacteria bacterium]|nr:MAG: uracil-DNA glycosylase [Deltaproteobacteria bacterium]
MTNQDLKRDFLEIVRSFKEYLLYLQDLNFEGLPKDKLTGLLGRQQLVSPATKETEDKAASLDALRKQISKCQLCPLGSSRTNLVFGTGSPDAQLVFVGEAPGRDEDLQGKPFVGKAGQLLTRIIKAIGLEREEVYIANILKCRPPENRNPLSEEIAACEPFLIKQLEIIKPKLIVALGTFAAQTLLKTTDAISRLRGRFHLYQGIRLMPTYHPAYLLRNPQKKRDVWEDMQIVQKEYQ